MRRIALGYDGRDAVVIPFSRYIAFVLAWAIEGGDPHPPGAGPYDCSLD
jgi:hypothetical protein